MNNVPMPDFSMLYEKTNITADIEPHLLELTRRTAHRHRRIRN